MQSVLEISGLRHSYDETVAFDGVDLVVEAGECIAFLGPNGAGKTTLVRSVIGLLRPDHGRVAVTGGDPADASVRKRMGVVQQEVGFPRTLTVWEVASGAADRTGVPRAPAHETLAEMGMDDSLEPASHQAVW